MSNNNKLEELIKRLQDYFPNNYYSDEFILKYLSEQNIDEETANAIILERKKHRGEGQKQNWIDAVSQLLTMGLG